MVADMVAIKETGTNGKRLFQPGGPGGPGRAKKTKEQQIVQSGLAAIEKRFGSMQKAFEWMLDYEAHKQSSIFLFAAGHVIGRPPERLTDENNKLHNLTAVQIQVIEKQTTDGNSLLENDLSRPD